MISENFFQIWWALVRRVGYIASHHVQPQPVLLRPHRLRDHPPGGDDVCPFLGVTQEDRGHAPRSRDRRQPNELRLVDRGAPDARRRCPPEPHQWDARLRTDPERPDWIMTGHSRRHSRTSGMSATRSLQMIRIRAAKHHGAVIRVKALRWPSMSPKRTWTLTAQSTAMRQEWPSEPARRFGHLGEGVACRAIEIGAFGVVCSLDAQKMAASDVI